MDGSDHISDLKKRIAELRARLPRHSIPPSMLMELKDLEEELERVRARAEGSSAELSDIPASGE
jgi:hypothetical protein